MFQHSTPLDYVNNSLLTHRDHLGAAMRTVHKACAGSSSMREDTMGYTWQPTWHPFHPA
jgi:hypothetical protein